MNLKQIEFFLRVGELGSFTQASQALDVAQPSVSRQIRMLEVELGQNLLNRNGRGVTLTEAGKLFHSHCKGILHQIQKAREDMGRIKGTLTGRIALGMAPSVSRMMTVPLTSGFQQALPEATLSISEGLSQVMQERLRAGHLDIGILYNPSPATGLELRPLTSEPLYVISHHNASVDGDEVALERLAELPLIVPNRPNTVRMLLESELSYHGCKPNIRLEIDSIPSILDLVASHAGHAVLTESAVSTSVRPDDYAMRPIVQPKLSSHLYTAMAPGSMTTVLQKTVLQLIDDIVRKVYPAALVDMS